MTALVSAVSFDMGWSDLSGWRSAVPVVNGVLLLNNVPCHAPALSAQLPVRTAKGRAGPHTVLIINTLLLLSICCASRLFSTAQVPIRPSKGSAGTHSGILLRQQQRQREQQQRRSAGGGGHARGQQPDLFGRHWVWQLGWRQQSCDGRRCEPDQPWGLHAFVAGQGVAIACKVGFGLTSPNGSTAPIPITVLLGGGRGRWTGIMRCCSCWPLAAVRVAMDLHVHCKVAAVFAVPVELASSYADNGHRSRVPGTQGCASQQEQG
jgi:hypothetical protein